MRESHVVIFFLVVESCVMRSLITGVRASQAIHARYDISGFVEDKTPCARHHPDGIVAAAGIDVGIPLFRRCKSVLVNFKNATEQFKRTG